jgi:hypothetical protein
MFLQTQEEEIYLYLSTKPRRRMNEWREISMHTLKRGEWSASRSGHSVRGKVHDTQWLRLGGFRHDDGENVGNRTIHILSLQ